MAKVKYENMRSCWEFGEASECRRGLMCGMGYTEEEQKRPLIAVVNSWNEYNPGHVHLDKLAERVKQGVREAGGLPLEVMTTGICDGMVLKDPRYIEVPSRNSIADQVELTVDGNFFDGMVLLSSCDSVVPGHLMGAARLNIPAIMVTGGYMPLGTFRGKEVVHIRAQDKVGAMAEGKIDPELYHGLIQHSWGICGGCTSMTTANSMCMMAEAMGMTLPGNSSMSAVSSEIRNLAYHAGKRIMEMVREGVTARQIITPESIRNAIAVDMAVAGSSNLILHLPAIATEAGLRRRWWETFDRASRSVPQIVAASPSGPWHLQEIDRAGGSAAILKRLLPLLHGDALTVTGKTIAENYAETPVFDEEIIRPLEHPVSTSGALYVLYGSLAPDGCIIKAGACTDAMHRFSGPARTFDSLDDALNALKENRIRKGDAAILRYLGPKAAFGTTAYVFQKELKGRGLADDVAIITDGRFSGGSSGLSIGYLSPEAALGGPLALVRDGDRIEIDLDQRRIDLLVSPEELKQRRSQWHWEFPADQYPPFLRLFSKNAGSLANGAVWE